MATATAEHLAAEKTPTDNSRWSRFDASWATSLFGTAVGAGILFLPINAGAGGVWPLLIATIIIGPMTYFAHRGLSHFVCASPRKGEDITVVAQDYFGKGVGRVITLLYFLAIYPIVLIYGVGITNTVSSLMENQLGITPPPRWILSGLLIGLMMLVMVAGQRIMLVVTQLLVYPLIALLLGVSLYLIPSWSLEGLGTGGGFGEISLSLWLVIPVLVFAFNHSPAISQFSLAMVSYHGKGAVRSASKVLAVTSIMLVTFTMFFVWSCVLSLGADGLAEARAANLPVLSYLANVHGAPIIAYLGPIIAIAAIFSSFFGHYLGAAEGAMGIVRSMVPGGENLPVKTLKAGVAVFIFLTTWLAAILNPNILSLIESLAGPVIAAILYIMPVVAFYTVPALQRFRGRASNVFVVIAGLVAISGIIASLLP